MDDLDAVTERALDEDVDEYLKEVDESIAEDEHSALPDAPTTIPKAVAASAEEETERVAVME